MHHRHEREPRRAPPRPPARREWCARFPEGVDLLLDAGPAPGGAPSTIVEVVERRLVLVAPGAIAWDRVLESLE